MLAVAIAVDFGRLFQTLIQSCTSIYTFIPFTHPDFYYYNWLQLFYIYFILFYFTVYFQCNVLHSSVFLWQSSFQALYFLFQLNKICYYFFCSVYSLLMPYQGSIGQTISMVYGIFPFLLSLSFSLFSSTFHVNGLLIFYIQFRFKAEFCMNCHIW